MEKNIQILQFQLKNKLKNNMELKRQLAPEWRLEPSRLAHYKTSNLLFSQPIPNTGKEYKCEFLLDVSGSMWWDSLPKAVRVLQNLIKLFYWIIDFKITCFWNGSYTVSPREILSIDTKAWLNSDSNKQYRIARNKFERRFTIREFNWETHFISHENWEYDVSWGTYWIWAVYRAGQELAEETGERFIVLITDGIDCISSYAKYMCWAPSKGLRYETIEEELAENWINLLPIWIEGTSTRWKNSIELDNTEDVYNEVLTFVDNNFN